MILECVECGKEFEAKSKGAYYCPECRKKRMLEARQNRVLGNFGFNAKIPGRPLPMEFKIREKYEKLRKERQPEKLDLYEDCPNFDNDKVSCLTCPAGVWKYKACGRVK